MQQGNELPWWDVRAYDYGLPRVLIAQHPAARRDESRLLVYTRSTGAIGHHLFRDLPTLLRAGDALVLNTCRVIPARLFARRADTGTRIEPLLTERAGARLWKALVRPGRSCRPGVTLIIEGPGEETRDQGPRAKGQGATGNGQRGSGQRVGGQGQTSDPRYQISDIKCRMSDVRCSVAAILPDGQRLIECTCDSETFRALLDTHGAMPLPPYIERPAGPSVAGDRERYQTVYAATGEAIAAPTAGLHFTPELLERVRGAGCRVLPLNLDVGIGTFQPVKAHDLREHAMHAERFALTDQTARALNETRARGGRIIAVGTTSLRVLETCVDDEGMFTPRSGETRIFIHPPRRVRAIDGLITNFHLPRSTLLMLVAAWIGDAWRTVYDEAVRTRYRFYSYGDASLLV